MVLIKSMLGFRQYLQVCKGMNLGHCKRQGCLTHHLSTVDSIYFIMLTAKLPVLLPHTAPLIPDEARQELSVAQIQVCQSSAYPLCAACTCNKSIP